MDESMIILVPNTCFFHFLFAMRITAFHVALLCAGKGSVGTLILSVEKSIRVTHKISPGEKRQPEESSGCLRGLGE